MVWECAACGRAYDEAPERCVCGSADVVPRDGEEGRPGVLERARAVVDPDAERAGLLADGPWIALLFRVVLVLSALLAVVLAATLLV